MKGVSVHLNMCLAFLTSIPDHFNSSSYYKVLSNYHEWLFKLTGYPVACLELFDGPRVNKCHRFSKVGTLFQWTCLIQNIFCPAVCVSAVFWNFSTKKKKTIVATQSNGNLLFLWRQVALKCVIGRGRKIRRVGRSVARLVSRLIHRKLLLLMISCGGKEGRGLTFCFWFSWRQG